MRRAKALFLALGTCAIVAGAASSSATEVPSCFGDSATIVGTPGDDTITGTEDDDVIVSLGGNDTIVGGGGGDSICSGDGNDSILQTSSALYDIAYVVGGAGDDTIRAASGTIVQAFYSESPGPVHVNLATGKATGEGKDTLIGVETVEGSRFDDVLAGSGKSDTLYGGAGNDTISGRGGDDMISGNGGDDIIDGGTGHDLTTYLGSRKRVHVNLAKGTATGEGKDRLKSIENVIGSIYADVIMGDSGPNRINGDDGNDKLYGLAGRDRLFGDRGRDHADGGPGRDICRVETMVNCP